MERVLRGFARDGERQVAEHHLPEISLRQLRELFDPPDDDPEMVYAYPASAKEFERLRELASDPDLATLEAEYFLELRDPLKAAERLRSTGSTRRPAGERNSTRQARAWSEDRPSKGTVVRRYGPFRKRWKDPKGNIFELNHERATVDQYDRHGRHKGEFDPNTAEQIGRANPHLRVEP